jgi:hypothetical protein
MTGLPVAFVIILNALILCNVIRNVGTPIIRFKDIVQPKKRGV